MKMIRLFVWLIVVSLLTAPLYALNQICTGIVQQALDVTHERCAQLGTNEACYGHARLDAQPQTGYSSFAFDSPGDVIDVTALRSLRLSALDEISGLWGVARMAVQPSAPDVDPGEQVTFLLFGDVRIQNMIPAPREADAYVLSRRNLNVRREPSLDSYVSRTLPTGTQVRAHGRTADNRWLYVETSDGEFGWVSAPAMQIDGGLQAINAIEPYAAEFGPMQAFRLESFGDGELLCDDMPESGVLIQTPDGVAQVSLWINEVKVRLGSTAYIRASRNGEMRITMLEGHAVVEAQGHTVNAPAGTELTIPLDQNLAPAAPPNQPAQIAQPINNLPVQELERPIPTFTPSPTPSLTPTPSPTVEPTSSPLPTEIPFSTATPTPSETPTNTPEPPTQVPTNTPSPTDTPTVETVYVPTETPTGESPTPTDAPFALNSDQQFQPVRPVQPAPPVYSMRSEPNPE